MPTRDAKDGRFVRERTAPWSHDAWGDGFVDNRGYFRVYRPDYPLAYSSGYAKRSHVVYWLATGHAVGPGEVVHHEDRNKVNDAFSNLRLTTHADHTREHLAEQWTRRPRAKMRDFVCETCGDPFQLSESRVADRERSGTKVRFCSPPCRYAAPRSEEAKRKTSESLRRTWAGDGKWKRQRRK